MLTVSGAPPRATQRGGVKPLELVLSGAERRPTLRSSRHPAVKAAGQTPLVGRSSSQASCHAPLGG
jgi:hypothetical protein